MLGTVLHQQRHPVAEPVAPCAVKGDQFLHRSLRIAICNVAALRVVVTAGARRYGEEGLVGNGLHGGAEGVVDGREIVGVHVCCPCFSGDLRRYSAGLVLPGSSSLMMCGKPARK